MINISSIDTKSMEFIEKEIALKMNLVALNTNNSELKDFFTDKITEEKLSYLRLSFGTKFTLKVLERAKIKQFLLSYYISFEINEEKDELYYILKSAIEKNSSDIHLEPYEDFGNVRFRRDGNLFIENKISMKVYYKIINRIKVLANLDISKKLEPQDGKLKFDNSDNQYDIRISFIPTTMGEKAVLRILYKNKEFINIENLRFNKEQRGILNKLLISNTGIVLVNGPTGSGKSTTLYAFINSCDKESKNISTIEDPAEFNIPGIIQSNVNNKIGFSFSVGLKYLLRQDPDIIMIGEIRDEETAKIAIRAAITGHKVFGTIHTSSAIGVYYRLLDMGVEPYLLRQSLKGAIAQRLIRKLCVECREKILFTDKYINNGEKVEVYKASGCNSCYQTGYKGRVMISDVIDFSDIDFGNLPRDENLGLINSAEELMLKGTISIEDFLLFREGERNERV